MENHSCPVCNKTDYLSSLCEVNGYSVYQCRHCTSDHVFPIPDKKTLKNYHDRRDWFEGGEEGGGRGGRRGWVWICLEIFFRFQYRPEALLR